MKFLNLIILYVFFLINPTYAGDNTGLTTVNMTPEDQLLLEELMNDAERGDSDAQLLLGHMYANGQGVPQDYAAAIKWYIQAAEQGSGDAQFMLGTLYAEGKGGKPDSMEAIRWYSMAAEQGNIEVQIILGMMYAEGQGIEPNLNNAIHWLNKAASNGNVQAQQYLQQIFAEMRQDVSRTARVQTVITAEPNEIKLAQYEFRVDGFSALFPFVPEKRIVQDNSRIRAIQYKAASRDDLIQYNISLQQFKGGEMDDDESRESFLTNYIDGRAMFAWKNRIQKQDLFFKNSLALQFKHITYNGRTEMIHEGIKFFSGNDSITLTCVYPSGAVIPISFEHFKDSFGFIDERKSVDVNVTPGE